MLKPAGTLSLSSGSLSGAAASGGPATGASLAAASPSGRPINGDPGGSAGAADGAAPAAGAAGCCAAAPNVNAPKKAPASNRLRGPERLIVIIFSLCGSLVSTQTSTPAARMAFLISLSDISAQLCNSEGTATYVPPAPE